MEFEGITTSGLNCSSQIQPSDQTSSRFIDRFIRLKNRYWNRGFLITLITLAGLTIQAYQQKSLIKSLLLSEEETYYSVLHLEYGMYMGLLPGGVLATVYSAHKVFGISFIISFILQIMEDMNYLKAYLHILSLFYIGIALAISASSFNRIYTFWIPLNKQSLSHVPIVLWTIVLNNQLPIYYDLTYTRKVLGIVGIAWFVLWLIVVSGDRSQSPNRGFILFRLFRGSNTTPLSTGTNVVSSRRPTTSGIPWKSFCTSMPVIMLVISYMFYSIFTLLHMPLRSNETYIEYVGPFNKYTTILLLLTLVLFELIPEITMFISITNVRKIFSVLYFISMATIYYLEAFPENNFMFSDNKKFVYLFHYFMPYFCLFGFEINHLDIAPQYASVLYGILMTIYALTWRSLTCYLIISEISLSSEDRYQLHTFWFLMAVISLAVAVYYVIFASAELQPWAVDIPVKEKRRNMQEEVNLMAVCNGS